MAHIRKHPVDPSKWQVRYRDGAGRERSRIFDRKIEAEDFAAAVRTDLRRGEWIDPDRSATTYAEWAERWLETRTHLKPKTLFGYESLLRTRVLPAFGNQRLDHIEPLAVEEWIGKMQGEGLSASRIRQAHQVLNASLKAAVRNKYLLSNPAEGASLPRLIPNEMRFLQPDEVEDLAMTIDPQYKVLVYVMAYGGLRWGELAALRRRRIEVLPSRIEIAESLSEVSGRLYFGTTKNHRSRTIAIPAFLRDMLNDHLIKNVPNDPEALVFTAPRGSPLRSSNFRQQFWNTATKAAGVPGILIHGMRHTCAAIMINQGAHPEAIKRHLGHSSIKVTMDCYGHLFPSEADAIAERLDRVYAQALADKPRTRPRELNTT